MTVPSFRASAATFSNASTGGSLNVATHVTGDLLVMVVCFSGSGITTSISGWTLRNSWSVPADFLSGASSCNIRIYTKEATSSSETATWSMSSSRAWIAHCLSFDNAQYDSGTLGGNTTYPGVPVAAPTPVLSGSPTDDFYQVPICAITLGLFTGFPSTYTEVQEHDGVGPDSDEIGLKSVLKLVSSATAPGTFSATAPTATYITGTLAITAAAGGGNHALVPNSIESATEVGSIPIVQTHVTSGETDTSISTVGAPNPSQAHHTDAGPIVSQSETTDPVLIRILSLSPSSNSSNSDTTDPVFIGISNLSASSIASATEDTPPLDISLINNLLAASIESQSSTTSINPAIGQNHVLPLLSIESVSARSIPFLSGPTFVDLIANSIESNGFVSITSNIKETNALSALSVEALTEDTPVSLNVTVSALSSQSIESVGFTSITSNINQTLNLASASIESESYQSMTSIALNGTEELIANSLTSNSEETTSTSHSPPQSGPKHLKCCCPEPADCQLWVDMFDRPDENPVSGRWVLKSGEWEIQGNILRNVTEGNLLTSIRQSIGPDSQNYATRQVFDLIGNGPWKVICKYTDESTYDYILYTKDGGVVWPSFYRNGALVMDKNTHPDGVGFTWDNTYTAEGGVPSVSICYSNFEWTTQPGIGSGLDWTYCEGDPATSLPPDCGLIGFRLGDFDNFQYYRHWESLHICPFCSCFCRDGVDEKCMSENLRLTLTPKVFHTDCTSSPPTLTWVLKQTQSSAVPFPLSPRKFEWLSEPFSDGYSSINFWWRFLCYGEGEYELMFLEHPSRISTVSDNLAQFITRDGNFGGSINTTVDCIPTIKMDFGDFQKFQLEIGSGGGVFWCDPFAAIIYEVKVEEI